MFLSVTHTRLSRYTDFHTIWYLDSLILEESHKQLFTRIVYMHADRAVGKK